MKTEETEYGNSMTADNPDLSGMVLGEGLEVDLDPTLNPSEWTEDVPVTDPNSTYENPVQQDPYAIQFFFARVKLRDAASDHVLQDVGFEKGGVFNCLDPIMKMVEAAASDSAVAAKQGVQAEYQPADVIVIGGHVAFGDFTSFLALPAHTLSRLTWAEVVTKILGALNEVQRDLSTRRNAALQTNNSIESAKRIVDVIQKGVSDISLRMS